MLAHVPGKAPLALNARYTENGVDLPLPDGLWRTLEKLGTYRLYVADPEDRMISFLTKGLENGAPVLIGTRLRVINHQITEMETVVGRLSSTTGGALLGTPPKDLSIDGEPRKQFLTDLPVGARRTPAQLAAIVNSSFTGLEGNTGDKPPEFAADCHRLENETPTTNVPVAPDAQPGAANMPCAKAFAMGYYHEDTRLRNRRILAVDVERGVVCASVFFDHDATVRKLAQGRSRGQGPQYRAVDTDDPGILRGQCCRQDQPGRGGAAVRAVRHASRLGHGRAPAQPAGEVRSLPRILSSLHGDEKGAVRNAGGGRSGRRRRILSAGTEAAAGQSAPDGVDGPHRSVRAVHGRHLAQQARALEHPLHGGGEYCRMLEGVNVITDHAGLHRITVRAGDEFVIPAGFRGT